ncbi:YbaN family protein [Myxococcota bacterium]|nr:YbaN family protein [Myxococcota bacterium]
MASEATFPAAPYSTIQTGPFRRIILFILGWLFFGLGVLGAVLPVLPTTPFMLLALWAFSRSSQRFHHWLYNHRLFGPSLQKWSTHRVIPLPVKITAFSFMALSFFAALFFSAAPPAGLFAMGAVMLAGATFIALKPSQMPK